MERRSDPAAVSAACATACACAWATSERRGDNACSAKRGGVCGKRCGGAAAAAAGGGRLGGGGSARCDVGDGEKEGSPKSGPLDMSWPKELLPLEKSCPWELLTW